jgi:hypothetical protein
MTREEIQEICKQYNVMYLLENESNYRCDTLWLNDTWIGDVDYFNDDYSVYDYVHNRFINTKKLLHELLADKLLMFKKFNEMKRLQKMKRDFND